MNTRNGSTAVQMQAAPTPHAKKTAGENGDFTVGEPYELPDYGYGAKVTFPDGQTWELEGASVIVPLPDIAGMTNAAIGRRVRALTDTGWLLEALPIAQRLLEQADWGPEAFADFAAEHAFVAQFAGWHPLIDQALARFARGEQPRPKRPPVGRIPEAGYVYVVSGPTGQYKIGRSKDVPSRIKNFVALKLPFDVALVHEIASSDMVWAEQQLHARFADQRVQGEWFALTPTHLADLRATARLDPSGGAL